MVRSKSILLLVYLFVATINCLPAKAQDKIDSSLLNLPVKYLGDVSEKSDKVSKKLEKRSEKALAKMQQEEERLRRKLASKDSLAAHNIFSNTSSKYKQLEEKLRHPGSVTNYIPHLDSLATSLTFLDKNSQLLSQAKEVKDKVKEAIAKTSELKAQLQKAEDIKKFLKERKEYLKQQLEKFGMVKDLKRINKEAYYYQQQVKEYVAIIKDPKKAEKKALELLSRTKMFQDFFKKNSMLASLFRMPGDPNDPAYLASLSGLQTRAQVNALIQQQIQSAGPNGMQQLRQQMQSAQAQLNELKAKVLTKFQGLGSANSGDIMPERFKPNNQKTKSFLQRLELGTNMQTQRASSYFPVTTDIGLSLGYKLNDKSVIGVGSSFKLGFGRGWEHIRFTSEGASLRSFIELKLKGSFWLTGGYELNYRATINRLDFLKDLSAWQRSGLLGLSKSITIKTKFFKQTKMQLLWDMLAREQKPQGQQFVFRVGYYF